MAQRLPADRLFASVPFHTSDLNYYRKRCRHLLTTSSAAFLPNTESLVPFSSPSGFDGNAKKSNRIDASRNFRNLFANVFCGTYHWTYPLTAFWKIRCLALDGLDLNTVHQLSRAVMRKNLDGAGIQTQGCWLGSKNASSELRSPLFAYVRTS